MYKHLFAKFLFVQNVRLKTIKKYGDQSVGVLSQYLFSLGSFNPDNLVTISPIRPLLVTALICSLFATAFLSRLAISRPHQGVRKVVQNEVLELGFTFTKHLKSA